MEIVKLKPAHFLDFARNDTARGQFERSREQAKGIIQNTLQFQELLMNIKDLGNKQLQFIVLNYIL